MLTGMAVLHFLPAFETGKRFIASCGRGPGLTFPLPTPHHMDMMTTHDFARFLKRLFPLAGH